MLDPPQMLKKKQYKSLKTLSRLQIYKTKCNCLNNASSYVDSITSIMLLELVRLMSSRLSICVMPILR